MLDLSHIILNEYDIARFAKKVDAKQFARLRGWSSSDVVQAFNRFQIFWVVGERLEENLRLAKRVNGATFVPYRKEMAS